jgi:hypothetical protein
MRPIVWLASYPKSGNTWFRMMVAGLSVPEGGRLDINLLAEEEGIASGRDAFESLTLIDPGLLTDEEIELVRPAIYRAWATGMRDMPELLPTDARQPTGGVRFIKCHDAHTLTARGEPLLGGRAAAAGAIVIVRDPRDVAVSLAHHMHVDIDRAIDFMADPQAAFSATRRAQAVQLRQRLPTWSGHVASWLDQTELPVHLVRYEDLQADTLAVFTAALEFAGHPFTPERAARAVALARFSALREQEEASGFREWLPGRAGGTFFRRGKAGGWRDGLTGLQVARIESAHAAMMTRLGYPLSGPHPPATAPDSAALPASPEG